jgi:hypothetical protein
MQWGAMSAFSEKPRGYNEGLCGCKEEGPRAGIFKLWRSPGIDYSASLCSLAGRYDNPIPTRFLASIDCTKIPALVNSHKWMNALLKMYRIGRELTWMHWSTYLTCNKRPTIDLVKGWDAMKSLWMHSIPPSHPPWSGSIIPPSSISVQCFMRAWGVALPSPLLLDQFPAASTRAGGCVSAATRLAKRKKAASAWWGWGKCIIFNWFSIVSRSRSFLQCGCAFCDLFSGCLFLFVS